MNINMQSVHEMGVWIVPPTSPLLPPEFMASTAIRKARDPRSLAVKLHEDEGGVRDAMRRRELPVVRARRVPRSRSELVDGELGRALELEPKALSRPTCWTLN